MLEVAPQYWQSPEGLKNIYLHTTAMGLIPLATMTTANRRPRPYVTIPASFRPSRFPSISLRHVAERGHPTCDADAGPARHASDDPRLFAGTLQAYQQSLSTEPYLIITALLAVYIVLGILYESLVHPLTIISTLPSASVGAIMALMLFKVDLNVISIIGIVLLIGIVKKNAIMMIDFALMAEREQE